MADDDSQPEATPVDPLIGTVINGKFRLTSLIGRGGMGRIYKAEQLSLNRMVAIKLLSIADRAYNVAEFRERFYREASLCARLSHPNIVTVHDYGRVEGAADETLWIAMEYLEGKTLMQRVKVNRWLSPQESTAIVVEIGRGIREAHKHGIVHRDLKCSNVMLVPDEEGGTRVKILDFGLVKSLAVQSEEEGLTIAGRGFLGSPGYMSPEQIQRGMPIDHRTDIYSLGVVLYRCLTGHNPFEGDQAQILLGHVNAPVPAMKEVNPEAEVPPALEGLVRRMLEKQAERRLSSAEEVVRSLRDVQESCGWSKPNPAMLYDNTGSFSKPQVLMLDPTPTTGGTVGPVAVSLTAPPKKKRMVMALIGVAAVATGVAIVIVSRQKEPPLPPPVAVVKIPAAAPAPPPPVVALPAVAPTPPPQAMEPAPPPVAPPPPPLSTPHATVKRPAAKAKPAVATSPPAPPPPAPPALKPVAPPAAAESGFLSLDTTPWSNVSESGRNLGQTPLIRMKMSEGQHTLTLTTDKGVSRTFTVTIKAGQTTSKRLGLE